MLPFCSGTGTRAGDQIFGHSPQQYAGHGKLCGSTQRHMAPSVRCQTPQRFSAFKQVRQPMPPCAVKCRKDSAQCVQASKTSTVLHAVLPDCALAPSNDSMTRCVESQMTEPLLRPSNFLTLARHTHEATKTRSSTHANNWCALCHVGQKVRRNCSRVDFSQAQILLVSRTRTHTIGRMCVCMYIQIHINVTVCLEIFCRIMFSLSAARS